jgi:hypothetical protein
VVPTTLSSVGALPDSAVPPEARRMVPRRIRCGRLQLAETRAGVPLLARGANLAAQSLPDPSRPGHAPLDPCSDLHFASSGGGKHPPGFSRPEGIRGERRRLRDGTPCNRRDRRSHRPGHLARRPDSVDCEHCSRRQRASRETQPLSTPCWVTFLPIHTTHIAASQTPKWLNFRWTYGPVVKPRPLLHGPYPVLFQVWTHQV